MASRCSERRSTAALTQSALTRRLVALLVAGAAASRRLRSPQAPDAGSGRRPRRWRSAPPIGSPRCRRNPRRSPRRSRRCSSSCASSRSIAQIKVEELAGIERDAAGVQQQLGRATERARGARSRTRERQEPDLEATAGPALQAGTRRLLAHAARRQRPARSRPGVSDRVGAQPHRSRSRRGASPDARGAGAGARGRSRSAPASCRRCRHAAARRAPRSIAPSPRTPRWSRRSTPGAISTRSSPGSWRRRSSGFRRRSRRWRPARPATALGLPLVRSAGPALAGRRRADASGSAALQRSGIDIAAQRHRAVAARRQGRSTPSTKAPWRSPTSSAATPTSSSSITATATIRLYGHLSSLSVQKGDRVEPPRRSG